MSLRVPEDRTLVLYFFSTIRESDPKNVIEQLNKASRRSDLLVIGLSAESKDRVEKFVESKRIKFPVGVKSTAYRKFKIKKFPHIIAIPPRECARGPDTEAVEVEELLRRFPPPVQEDAAATSEFDENSTIETLKANARENPDRDEALRALGLLRLRIPTEDFLNYCDQLLQSEDNYFRRGNVHFQRNLADPTIPAAEKEPLLEPVSEARRLNRETPDDPEWDPLREHMDHRETLTMDQLFDEYLAHQGRGPSDLLIRSSAVSAIADQDDHKRVREMLVQMLPSEGDAVIRMSIAFGFASACEPGDFEAADLLEKHLRTETNFRSTRPAMEYVIRYLRTGEE